MATNKAIEAAKARKVRAIDAYKAAKEAAANDPMRRMLGGLAPSCVREMTAKQEYHAACSALKAIGPTKKTPFQIWCAEQVKLGNAAAKGI